MTRLIHSLSCLMSLCLGTGFIVFANNVLADDAPGEILSVQAYLQSQFGNDIPEPSLAWLTGERGEQAEKILGHKPDSLRIRYWRDDTRSVWVLNEIGRDKPITAGFMIVGGKLQDVRVLAFRETRGWEIRHEFFTRQFLDIGLADDTELDGAIDNITGATLSVDAMRRMARLALFLDGDT